MSLKERFEASRTQPTQNLERVVTSQATQQAAHLPPASPLLGRLNGPLQTRPAPGLGERVREIAASKAKYLNLSRQVQQQQGAAALPSQTRPGAPRIDRKFRIGSQTSPTLPPAAGGLSAAPAAAQQTKPTGAPPLDAEWDQFQPAELFDPDLDPGKVPSPRAVHVPVAETEQPKPPRASKKSTPRRSKAVEVAKGGAPKQASRKSSAPKKRRHAAAFDEQHADAGHQPEDAPDTDSEDDSDKELNGAGGGSSKSANASKAAALRALDEVLGISHATPAALANGPGAVPAAAAASGVALPPPNPFPASSTSVSTEEEERGWVISMDNRGMDVDPDSDELYLEVTVPYSITRFLRDYQRVGVRFLLRQYARGVGGLLADDMGLGKTLQTIAFIAAVLGKTGDPVADRTLPRLAPLEPIPAPTCDYIANRTPGQVVAEDDLYIPVYDEQGDYPVLVVCPTAVLTNWQEEFDKWGTFRVAKYHGDFKDRTLRAVMAGHVEVLLTTPSMVRLNQSALAGVPWHLVVFDEAHLVKNPASATAKAADRLPTRLRYALTGTPQSNKYAELHAVVSWAAHGCAGSLGAYSSQFENPMKLGMRTTSSAVEIAAGVDAQRRLRLLLGEIMLRRNKSIIAHQLPEKHDHIVFCELAPLQLAAYKRVLQLPDIELLLISRTQLCPCGSGQTIVDCKDEYCEGYWRCTYDQGGVIYPHYHLCECGNAYNAVQNPKGCRNHRPKGCWRGEQRTCPFCISLPVIMLLRKVANHLDLVKANPKDERSPDEELRIKFRWNKEVAELVLGEDADALGGVVADKEFQRMVDSAASCGKMRVMMSLLRQWRGDKSGDKGLPHKVLLFSNSVRMLEVVEAMLLTEGYDYKMLTGATRAEDRQAMVHECNNPSSSTFAFLISTAAGGTGLNLTGANRVIILDPSWSPANDLQAMDRSFRIGQARDVKVYRLIAAGTIEEMQYKRQISKQQHSNMAVEGAEEQPRLFEAAQGMSGHGGELWGLANLLRHEAERVEAMDIVAGRHRNRGGAAGGGGGTSGCAAPAGGCAASFAALDEAGAASSGGGIGVGGFTIEPITAEALEKLAEESVDLAEVESGDEGGAAAAGGGGKAAAEGQRKQKGGSKGAAKRHHHEPVEAANGPEEATLQMAGVAGVMRHTAAFASRSSSGGEAAARRAAVEETARAQEQSRRSVVAAVVAGALSRDPSKPLRTAREERALAEREAAGRGAASAAHLSPATALAALSKWLGLPERVLAAHLPTLSEENLEALLQRYATSFADAGCACGVYTPGVQ